MKNWNKEIALVVSAFLLILYIHNFEHFTLHAEETVIITDPIIVKPDDKE